MTARKLISVFSFKINTYFVYVISSEFNTLELMLRLDSDFDLDLNCHGLEHLPKKAV